MLSKFTLAVPVPIKRLEMFLFGFWIPGSLQKA
jgi:hypothetical protein